MTPINIRIETLKAQGPRSTMEDRLCVQKLVDGSIFIGVFDGHGGYEVAEMCVDLAPMLMTNLLRVNSNVSECMKQLYKSLDMYAKPFYQVGATAAIVLIRNHQIWFSNCGDTMIALKSRNGNVQFLSQDHKVEYEKDRIQSLGGFITTSGGCARVGGILNIGRSIGDQYLKDYVISDPYIVHVNNIREIEWIIVASDGLWDVFTPYKVAKILADTNNDLGILLRQTYLNGCTDNVSIALVVF